MKKLLYIIQILFSFSAFSQEQQSLFNLDFFNQSNNDNVGFTNNPISKSKYLKPNKTAALVQIIDSSIMWGMDFSSNNFSIKLRKVFYSYDANNNIANHLLQQWNGTTWVNLGKLDYTYDVNNNQTSLLEQYWNGTTFVNYRKYAYTYDVNNNLLSKFVEDWNTTNSTWGYSGDKYTYTYDANNNQTSSLWQSWSNTTSAYVNNNKYAYTYDVNNNQTSSIQQNWNTTTWVNSKKNTYTYDVNNNQTSELGQDWNTTTSAWVSLSRNSNTYDANNNLISTLREVWGTTTWGNYFLLTYSYDANNNLTYYFSQRWNGVVWEDYGKIYYAYDVNNNQTYYFNQYWNTSTSAWEGNQKIIYTYDANSFKTSYKFYAYNQPPKIVPSSADSTYYYFHTVVGINEFEKSNLFSIYPNPSKGLFNIKTETAITSIEVYNNIGILVSKPEIKSINQIDLSNLSKGMYFLKVSNGKQYHTEKVIIE